VSGLRMVRASSTSTSTRRRDAGVTLVEVMISLGILFGALVICIRMTAQNVRAAHKAKQLTIATFLAKGKMLDIEESLRHDGFQDTSETLEGDFGEEGHPHFTWKAEIEKVELPPLNALAQAEGKEGEDTPDKPSGIETLLGNQAGGLGGENASMGAAMIVSQFDMVKGVLENAIRKVTLTVEWPEGKTRTSFQVVCYFTEPKAIDDAFGKATP
jgi:general secretion pathway protein I